MQIARGFNFSKKNKWVASSFPEVVRVLFVSMMTFLMFLSGHAKADDGHEKPKWAKDLRYQASGTAHFQVGISTNAKSPEDGRSNAYNDALANILRAEFPERQRLQESSKERLKDSEYTRQYDLDTGDIRLTGIEEATELGSPFIETKELGGHEVYSVYRLLRWKLTDIEEERRRLLEEERGSVQPAIVINARLGRQEGTTGALKVFTQPPGADITLDGSLIGKSPSEFKLVGPGTYDITMRLDGHEFKKETITIASGEIKVLKAALPKLQGEVTISSSPNGARIIIDGVPLKQRTPAVAKIDVGEHLIRVELSDFESETRTLHLDAFAVTMHFPMKYEKGILSVTSEPNGADVAIDGLQEKLRTTPLYNKQVLGGIRKVTISKAGYETYSEEVNILKSKGRLIHRKLVPEQASKLKAGPEVKINLYGNGSPEDKINLYGNKDEKSEEPASDNSHSSLRIISGCLLGIGVASYVMSQQESSSAKSAFGKYQASSNPKDAIAYRKETKVHDGASNAYKGLSAMFGAAFVIGLSVSL